MRYGHTARRFCLLAAALLLTDTANATTPTGRSDGRPAAVKVGDIVFELVRIPAGRFLMGASSGDSDERPIHEVSIDYDFWMGRTEVTVRQFRAFAEATGYKTDAERAGWANVCPLPGLHSHQRGLDWRRPGHESTDDHPVVVISRSDAMAFCRWLSDQTGRTMRLPTEAEWEYAARAGRQGESAEGADDAAWYEENASGTQPVGAKKANVWGLYDMQGNACEWCLDVYRADYRGVPADGSAWREDPVLPQPAWRYVLRGGSWASPVRQLSLSYRSRRMQNFCRPDTGLRIVLSAVEQGSSSTSLASVPQEKRGHAACTCHRQTGRTILTTRGVRFEFVRIPAGEFMMGGAGEIEKPWHKVRIGYEFEMGVAEVTVAQFRAFVKATGYVTDGQKEGYGWLRHGARDWQCEENLDWCRATFDESDDHPAVLISWYDAMAFCHWLSVETGQEIRLPSEAEWEHACRAGTTGLFAGAISAMGWSQHNSWGCPHPVAQKEPNGWGLYDMHGNVWEWCLDFFALSYDGAPADGRPRWNVDGPTDVISRGGSFANPPGWLASGCRMGTPPSASHYNNGFRLVRVVKDADRFDKLSTRSQAAPLVAIQTDLPKPIFVGTEKDIRVPRTKPVQREAGPPFLAPAGTKNVALGKPVSASDAEPIIGDLEMITDGDKEAADGSYVELGPMLQHVTINLQAEYEIYGIRVWHFHKEPRVYFDVIVQVCSDPDFINDVQTIFNSDIDNSAGLGVGTDMHYVDTHFGEIFDAKGLQGRYVRLYSNGSTADDLNHYVEVEVYGRPAEGPSDLVPLRIDYARAIFISHRSDDFMDRIPNLERPQHGPPPVLMVPGGTRNVALGRPVTSSDSDPIIGQPEVITDGAKEHNDLHVELDKGLQHVTIDLEGLCEIYAIALWHYHVRSRAYFDVIVQIANDPKFETDVTTVFSNDHDNSAGMGVGRDKHYVDTLWGKLVPVDGVQGRFVRLYSNGNDQNELNQYLEVEVYGRLVSEDSHGDLGVQGRRAADGTRLVPLEIDYPKPAFVGFGRWEDVPYREDFPIEPPTPLLVPEGTRNLALRKPVISSHPAPIIGRLDMVTDGDKDFGDGHYVELSYGQMAHITIDLQQVCEIYAVAVWHNYRAPVVYFDVILQISEGTMGSWTRNTLYNSDLDNSAGLGVGRDRRYVETHFGKVIPVDGMHGRYIRLYSRGNTADDVNHYIEVEVYGRPVNRR